MPFPRDGPPGWTQRWLFVTRQSGQGSIGSQGLFRRGPAGLLCSRSLPSLFPSSLLSSRVILTRRFTRDASTKCMRDRFPSRDRRVFLDGASEACPVFRRVVFRRVQIAAITYVFVKTELDPSAMMSDRRRSTDVQPKRKCSVAIRNQRLAAIHALVGFIGERCLENLEWSAQIRSLAFSAPHTFQSATWKRMK